VVDKIKKSGCIAPDALHGDAPVLSDPRWRKTVQTARQDARLYKGLGSTGEAFVRVILQKMGEWPACALASVLAGETRTFVGLTATDISLIYDYAKIEGFAMPDIVQKPG
jgi:hypothetical protein